MGIWRLSLPIVFLCACIQAESFELLTEDDPPHNMPNDKKIIGMSAEKLEGAIKRVGVPAPIYTVAGDEINPQELLKNRFKY